MLYYRQTATGRSILVKSARAFSTASLFAYPAGALTMALGPDRLATTIIGFTLIVASLACYLPLSTSWLQRIVAEQASKLDEFELKLRNRAMNGAYVGFTLLTLVAVVYAAIASDAGAWVPRTYDEFNGLFWGVFLYSTVLPVACLSWMLDQSADPDA
jgi:hypothetical protein